MRSPSYIELPETRDAMKLEYMSEREFAEDPSYVHLYRKGTVPTREFKTRSLISALEELNPTLNAGTSLGCSAGPRDPLTGRQSQSGSPLQRGKQRMSGARVLGFLVVLLGGFSRAAEPQLSASERRRSFVPSGWEVFDCPPAYGADAVLCASTDASRWKVDRHIPTLSVRAPARSCVEAEKDLVNRASGHRMSVLRRSAGRCGPDGAACTQLRFEDPRPTDPVAQFVYVVCPAGDPV